MKKIIGTSLILIWIHECITKATAFPSTPLPAVSGRMDTVSLKEGVLRASLVEDPEDRYNSSPPGIPPPDRLFAHQSSRFRPPEFFADMVTELQSRRLLDVEEEKPSWVDFLHLQEHLETSLKFLDEETQKLHKLIETDRALTESARALTESARAEKERMDRADASLFSLEVLPGVSATSVQGAAAAAACVTLAAGHTLAVTGLAAAAAAYASVLRGATGEVARTVGDVTYESAVKVQAWAREEDLLGKTGEAAKAVVGFVQGSVQAYQNYERQVVVKARARKKERAQRNLLATRLHREATERAAKSATERLRVQREAKRAMEEARRAEEEARIAAVEARIAEERRVLLAARVQEEKSLASRQKMMEYRFQSEAKEKLRASAAKREANMRQLLAARLKYAKMQRVQDEIREQARQREQLRLAEIERRRIVEQARRLEEARMAEVRRLEEARMAEERRLEAERIAREEERIALEYREVERIKYEQLKKEMTRRSMDLQEDIRTVKHERATDTAPPKKHQRSVVETLALLMVVSTKPLLERQRDGVELASTEPLLTRQREGLERMAP